MLFRSPTDRGASDFQPSKCPETHPAHETPAARNLTQPKPNISNPPHRNATPCTNLVKKKNISSQKTAQASGRAGDGATSRFVAHARHSQCAITCELATQAAHPITRRNNISQRGKLKQPSTHRTSSRRSSHFWCALRRRPELRRRSRSRAPNWRTLPQRLAAHAHSSNSKEATGAEQISPASEQVMAQRRDSSRTRGTPIAPSPASSPPKLPTLRPSKQHLPAREAETTHVTGNAPPPRKLRWRINVTRQPARLKRARR